VGGRIQGKCRERFLYAFPVLEPHEMAEAASRVHGRYGELERLVPIPPRPLLLLHDGDDLGVERECVGGGPVELRERPIMIGRD